ncbi:hypothetical protein PMAYCL1PPCAC_32554 [Pristionchus mayeri]|uniref:Uncharacterized protein n=1 Tax=Pristionchus mayeri TaxID=1317129 RepID=A0AAN5DGI6_9BILA|nr:hypothetical protein PMAYCL1PPCAC_32554 [Pristionchus mayeri]
MRLLHNLWSILLLAIVCTAFYVRLNPKYRKISAPIVVAQLYNNKTRIKITILGQDDGSRRKQKLKANEKNSMTCNIPKLDVNGSDVIKFFSDPSPIHCKQGENWVYIDKDNTARLIPERKGANCHTQAISFETDTRNMIGPKEILVVGKELPHEMAIVTCSDNTTTWEASLLSLRKVKKATKNIQRKRWSVLMMSFDSEQKLNFRRKLPTTVGILEELGAVIMNGYNIVGDGTPQVFIPILTGGTEEELPLTRKRFDNASFVDDVYPFIWSNFSQAGYATLFAEDQSNLGMMNYRLKGFRRPPTDHYTRPYFKQNERMWRTNNVRRVGSDLQHKHWLRYARQFLEVYKGVPRFGLMHHCVR